MGRGQGGPAAGGWRIIDFGEWEDSTLTGYFMAEVITGPGAFALPAAGFDAYQSAMTTKLLRELAVLSLAQLGDEAPPALRALRGQ